MLFVYIYSSLAALGASVCTYIYKRREREGFELCTAARRATNIITRFIIGCSSRARRPPCFAEANILLFAWAQNSLSLLCELLLLTP